MAISVLSKSAPRPIPGGQEGTYEQWFTCAWSTTDTTGTVPSGLRKVLRVKGFTFLQEPATDEVMYYAGTLNADGSIVLASGETITLGRVALVPTSALKFTFAIEGYV